MLPQAEAIAQEKGQPPPPILSGGPSMFGTNATIEKAQESDFIHSNGNTFYNKVVLNFPAGAREHEACQ